MNMKSSLTYFQLLLRMIEDMYLVCVTIRKAHREYLGNRRSMTAQIFTTSTPFSRSDFHLPEILSVPALFHTGAIEAKKGHLLQRRIAGMNHVCLTQHKRSTKNNMWGGGGGLKRKKTGDFEK